MRIGDYELREQIHASTSSRVHRARRITDDLEVFVKTPAPQASAGDSVARLRHELLVCRMFDAPDLIRAIELIEIDGRTALVLESVAESVTLRERATASALPVREVLRVALAILDALARLHARNIVHKDLKPDNVLVDTELRRVVLIDFGIAAIVPRDSGSVAANVRLEGTLPFMPPEQTGRINRPIDYRSDYYALGATLYWMLAGEPPFGDLSEPEEFVHAHIARVPPSLTERNPEVPPALARIVAKLLSKAADERYQGTFGLRRDLRRCLDELAAGEQPDFAVAEIDPAEHLRLPHHLYGRERQLASLAAAFGAVDESPQVVMLHGGPGAGKTTLARELLASIVSDAVVVEASFERGEGTDALAGIGALLQGLLVEQLDRDPGERAELEQRLRSVGPNVALLYELVPELRTLLGPQPAAAPVGPGQARDRFRDTLDRFVAALLSPLRRYLLFVDDVEQLDETGARVLETLCVGRRRRVLLLLASQTELEAEHGDRGEHERFDRGLLARVRARGLTVIELRLDPLAPGDVVALVDDALDGTPGCRELAALIHRRTGGTPLFVSQWLNDLYIQGIVDIDRDSGRWRVDLERASLRESSGDVVEYLVARFTELPEQTRRILGVAACIGPSFDPTTLAEIAGEPVSEAIWEAAAAGYLLTVSDGRLTSGGRSTTPGGSAVEYRFTHDRLRRIALDAAPRGRAPLQLAIARTLARQLDQLGETEDAEDDDEPPASAEQLGRVAEHVSAAIELLVTPIERARFASICETAGELARASAAYASAARHFETALRLMSHEGPSRRLQLALALGEALYMSGRSEAADAVFDQARALVDGRAELARLLMVRELLVQVRNETERALEIAMEAAAVFELDLRRGGSEAWAGELVNGLLREVEDLTPEVLLALPVLEDPEQICLINLLSAATYPAYVSGDARLFAALLVAAIRRALAAGLTDTVAICFMQLGMVMVSRLRDHERARRCAALGFATIERFPGSPVTAQVEAVYYGTLQFLLEPFAEGLAPITRIHHELRALGALIPAGYAVGGRIIRELLIGVPLAQVVHGCSEAIDYVVGIGDEAQELQMRVFLAGAEALQRGPTSAGLMPEGGEGEHALLARQAPMLTLLSYTCRAYVCTLLGDRPAAAAALAVAEPVASVAAGHLGKPWFELVRALFDCEDYPSMAAEQARAHERRIDALLSMLGRWEQSCPANGTPLRCLVGGAWALARGRLDEAYAALSTAADAAAAQHFHNLEGLACELAARVLLARGERRHAIGYLGDALEAYGRWGSLPLQRRIRDALRERGHFALTSSGSTSSLEHGVDPGRSLDVATVVKMSQAMLEATELEEVIGELLATVNQNAGGDRCLLLLNDDEGPRIRAERRASGELFLLDRGLELDKAGQLLAVPIVRACARSRDALIVDDALRDPRCARDPYVRGAQVRAVLVVPVFTRRRQVGILYLENHLTPGAFTTQHLQLATTLATQAAISIENARLFDALREGEDQWRAVVSGAPDFIVIVDRRRRVEFANRVSYGHELDGILGTPIEQFVTPQSRARMVAGVEFVYETGTPTSFEVTLDSPDGPRLLTIRVGPIMRDGLVDRVTLIATDITEQRRLEEDLRHSQKMQAVGTLAGGVAHDFNNLLTVIIGACDLCSLQAAGHEGIEPLLEEIGDAATRAASLTRQLLAFSRKQMLQPKRFDLAGLVRELGRMLTRLLGEHVRLLLELDEGPSSVFADPDQLSQVIVNLAVNARDAMPEGGTVHVRVGPSEAGAVVLEVSDTGQGMDEELQRHIFEPFFTTKGEGKGTGLGLSTVLGIVEQSGGHIGIDSEPGRGSTFRVELPAADEAEGRAVGATTSLPRGTESILLVEDELAVQRLAARMLELQGYRVRVAATGEQAVAIASELPELDLLITDVVMSGISGPEVALLVVREHPRARVLYTSGHTSDEVLHRGVQDGTRTLLQKPFTREALARQVRAILDRPAD